MRRHQALVKKFAGCTLLLVLGCSDEASQSVATQSTRSNKQRVVEWEQMDKQDFLNRCEKRNPEMQYPDGDWDYVEGMVNCDCLLEEVVSRKLDPDSLIRLDSDNWSYLEESFGGCVWEE